MKYVLLYTFSVINLILSVTLSITTTKLIKCRSIFRPKDLTLPTIISSWDSNTSINNNINNKSYSYSNSHLEKHALTNKFNHDHFMKNRLPKNKIKFRNSSKSIASKKLDQLSKKLIKEIKKIKIQNKKPEFKNFKILKDKDFNYSTKSGNIVLKYKKYPFILKLFMETPETFVKPFSKGWQPASFFLMSGGVSRFLSGFTRIKNLNIIKQKINQHPYWSKKIDFPRKWFWHDNNEKWLKITTKNIGTKPITVKFPSVYGVIVDSIEKDKESEPIKIEEPKFGLKLSYHLGNRLDPHLDNFMLEKDTGKIVIIDTEHFPSMLGIKKPINFTSYPYWYATLAFKCLENKLTYSKKYRKDIQIHPKPPLKL